MKVYTKRDAGEDLLYLEATTKVEANIINDFSGYGEVLVTTIHQDPHYKYPLIVTGKETS